MLENGTSLLPLMQFAIMSGVEGVGHFISTRKGGVSDSPYDTLNISFRVGDDAESVRRNRERLYRVASVPPDGVTMARLAHEDHVCVVTKALRGRGMWVHEEGLQATDAMITDEPDICLLITVADCAPIILMDQVRRAVGVVHAGRRGTTELVVKKTVRRMKEEYGCAPGDILAGIGPSIGPCCYDVAPDMVGEIEAKIGMYGDVIRGRRPDGGAFIDLWTANRGQLLEEGVLLANIELSEICTFEATDTYFSARHAKKRGHETGRFSAGVMLLR